MSEPSRQRLGTISILLGAVPVLALISWFVFYTPCGHPRRAIIENIVIWGTVVAVPFGIFACVKEKPRKRALFGLALGLVPLICFVLLVVAIVSSIAAGGKGIPGILDLAMSGANNAPMTFDTGVFVTTETKYYDIKGSTLEELQAQVASLGPHGFMAETVPFYHWNYTYKKENGTCRIDRVRVETRIVFTYPRLNDPAADPALADELEKRVVLIRPHEGEHEGIDRRTGQEIYDTIAGLQPAPSCAELEKELDARAQGVIAKGREANDELDRATDHGKRPAEAT